MLAKTIVVNLEISSGLKQDTICGNIHCKYSVKIACTMCGNENRNMIYVLCVETLHFAKL